MEFRRVLFRSPGKKSRSTKVSKNQLVCARCHLAGEASGIDCTVASASDNGSTSARLSARTASNRVASGAGAGGRRSIIVSPAGDRKSVVKGKSVSVRVDLGGRRYLKKKK